MMLKSKVLLQTYGFIRHVGKTPLPTRILFKCSGSDPLKR